MPQFRSLKELQDYLEHNVADVLDKQADIVRILADTMSDKVVEVVYKAYTPEQYVRRHERSPAEAGLSDPRNMEITDIRIENGKAVLVFENLTEGDDNMQGQYIVDIIEEGSTSAWENSNGPWSNPREFVAATAEELRNNPQGLIDALKKGLASKGFTVK